MLTCIIIEDQPPAQRILKKYIEDVESLTLLNTFTEATKAMDFMGGNAVDLIFLDIHLPKISGIDFLRILPYRPSVILTTAFPEYALEGYELNVVDYLLKPFSFQRFVQAVSKVKTSEQRSPGPRDKKNHPPEVFIKSGYEYLKLTVEHIRFIKSSGSYTEIYVNGKKHISSEPLRYWIDLLDNNQFVRIHKSYIVNTAKISKVLGNRVYLANEEVLPIGRAYKDHFSERFLK